MIYLTNRYIENVNKNLYLLASVPIPNKLNKLALLNLLDSTRKAEKKYLDDKEKLIEKHCKKDDEGKRLTVFKKVNGHDTQIYVFKNQDEWAFDCNELLDKKADVKIKEIEISFDYLLSFPHITVDMIMCLNEFGIIKNQTILNTDTRGKLIYGN